MSLSWGLILCVSHKHNITLVSSQDKVYTFYTTLFNIGSLVWFSEDLSKIGNDRNNLLTIQSKNISRSFLEKLITMQDYFKNKLWVDIPENFIDNIMQQVSIKPMIHSQSLSVSKYTNQESTQLRPRLKRKRTDNETDRDFVPLREAVGAYSLSRGRAAPDKLLDLEYNNYVIGNYISKYESNMVEFKSFSETYLPNQGSREIIEKYVIGFLNSQQGGDIYFGIENNSRISGTLKSVNISQQIDRINQQIIDVLNNCRPYIDPKLYSVQFHNVYRETDSDKSKPVQDRWVVQIHVNPSNNSELYVTSHGQIFIRQLSSTIELSVDQIRELRQSRNINTLRGDSRR